jgi:hypothetical protein
VCYTCKEKRDIGRRCVKLSSSSFRFDLHNTWTFHNQPPAQFISGRHHREICVAGHIHISKLANGQQSCRVQLLGNCMFFALLGNIIIIPIKMGQTTFF